jgi:hypothetical protein
MTGVRTVDEAIAELAAEYGSFTDAALVDEHDAITRELRQARAAGRDEEAALIARFLQACEAEQARRDESSRP